MAKKEYIEREAAIDFVASIVSSMSVCVSKDEWIGMDSMKKRAVSALKDVPAADVRPVVLCRECKWCHAGYCEKYDDLIPFGCANKPWEDWFCADGAMLKK